MTLLDSLCRALFRPNEGPIELEPGAIIGFWGLLAVVWALPVAGSLGLGGMGAFTLILVFFGGLLVAWFWVGAAISLLARLAGGRGTVEATLGAIAQANWPLVLLPSAAGVANLSGFPQGEILLLAIAAWAAILGVLFVRRVHGLSWGRALMSWITLASLVLLTLVVSIATLVAYAAAILRQGTGP